MKDDASGIKNYKFGYSINGGEVTYDAISIPSSTRVFDEFTDSEVLYSAYVIVTDNAGNSQCAKDFASAFEQVFAQREPANP